MIAAWERAKLEQRGGRGSAGQSIRWERPNMLGRIKAAWSRLTAAREASEPEAAAVAPTEYKGYRIRPTPFKTSALYQTAGTIEKDSPDGVKTHRFIRADTHHSREDAVAFAISKAKQIIDLQGDRMFAGSPDR
jgi:hypothetical protein